MHHLFLQRFAIFFSCFVIIEGYPEIGFLAKLPTDISRTTSGWKKLSGWATSLTDVKGLYRFDVDLASTGDIYIPMTGIYFVSVTLPVTGANQGLFQAGLIINDVSKDKSIGLLCKMENMTTGNQMLSFAGFINLRAGENVSIYAYSGTDTSWMIKSQSSLTFHFYGRYGSNPAFLATPLNSTVISNAKNTLLHTWKTTGRAGVFKSLTGLTRSSGKFTTVCTGIYILTANIIVEGGVGEYSISTMFNGRSSVSGSIFMERQGIATINVYQAFFLSKGATVDLALTTSAGSVTVLEQSTWSMAFLGGTSSNTKEFASFLRSSVSETGGSWKKLSGLLRDSATQAQSGSDSGQFIQPSNLDLVNTRDFAVRDQADMYYAFVHLVFSGNATTLEAMTAVSADASSAVGKEGAYGTITKVNQKTTTISLSGIFHIRKQEHLNVFIKSQNPQDNFVVHNTSFVSFVRMRYAVSAFSARIQTRMTMQKSGWNELTGPWLTETYGLFSYGQDFSPTTGRFTASHSGVYIVSGNIQINRGDGAEIGLVVAKNNKIDLNNGLYAVNGEPSPTTTLNVYGSVTVRTGDQLSLYAFKSTSSEWIVDIDSGFSIVYIGPNWAAYGFHAVLSNDKVITSNGDRPLDFWTVNNSNTDMTYVNSVGFDFTKYTSPVDGAFIVSANILVRNVSIPGSVNGASTFSLEGYINGKQLTSIGLSDMKPTFADNTRDYYTLSFSSAVRMIKGQYLSLYLSSPTDNSYTISKQSGFSVVYLSEFSSLKNQGMFGSKDTEAHVSDIKDWTGVVDLSTSNAKPGRFSAGNGLVTTPEIYYSVPEPGIYYVTGNFRLSNAGGGNLFEVHAEIDSSSSKITGLYAAESSPKGTTYNLNFAGSWYLTFGQQVKITVKTAKSIFVVEKGTSFSVLKIQLDQTFPGLVVDKTERSFTLNQRLTNWEETTKPGLLTSNTGYDAIRGSYTPPVSGIYILSINNYLKSLSNINMTSISMIDQSNRNSITAYASYGSNRTMLATSALYLNANKTLNYQLNSSAFQSYDMDAGLSLYFIKTANLIAGFSSMLAEDFTVSSADEWITITNWTTTSQSSFSSVLNSQIGAYSASNAGAYFVSFSPLFTYSAAAMVKVAVSINSSTFLLASSSYLVPDSKLTVPVSGNLRLNVGDIVTFQVYSSVSGLILGIESSCSLIFIEGITTNTEGVAATKSSTESVSGSSPVQLNGFNADKTGGYLARNGTVDAFGVLINFHAGTFHYTTNIIVKNKHSRSSNFRLYTVINNENESPLSLQSVQNIGASSEETLSFSSSMFLPRFSRVQTLITADDASATYEILANSSYTFILIDDNTGPVICEDQGLNMERIVPDYVRISTEKSVTFTCAVVGSIPAQLSWLRNGVVISGQTKPTFTIDPTQLIDTAEYTCKGTYQSLTAVSGNATLSVYDPTPSITALQYSVSVNENQLVGIPILQTFTVSADKFAINKKAIVAAYIVDGDPFGDFQMTNASTTTISISTKRQLDYEKKNSYSLSITAVNTEEPMARNTTIIFNVTVIDINDNAPMFEPGILHTDVPEDLAVGDSVVTMRAIDPDSGPFAIVTYSIVSNLSRSTFDINSTTGEVTLIKSLDRETEDTYCITVLAKDQLFSSFAEIVVKVTDVNDNRPTFKHAAYSLSIVENIPVGGSIMQIFATDPDFGLNASLSFSMVAGDENNHFSIDNSSGVITLIKALNYEQNTNFLLVIGLTDQGSPVLESSINATVTVNILDINDNFPQFEKSMYTARISENINISANVLQVKATDRDGTTENSNFTFSINQTLASKFFVVDKYTGVISTKAKMDFESVKAFHFSVIATDNAAIPYTRHTNIIIYVVDTNDESPYFQSVQVNTTLSEYARPGAFVVNLFGLDNDTTKSFQFYIISQAPQPHFGIEQETGALFVQHHLDRENITMYNLTVGLSDGINSAANPATVTIYILDENDNSPVFTASEYRASIYENATVGASVLSVHAEDADINSNAAVTYSIYHTGFNDSYQFFNINSTTGEITLSKLLNFEVQKIHRFIVLATDGGSLPRSQYVAVEVTVLDINDNAPYFTQLLYTASIPESINIGNIVSVIKATDDDSAATQLTYEIVNGDSDNHFRFMPSMPNVIVTASLLDYEKVHYYQLEIRASDGTVYSSTNATVQVNVTDINDENPIFNSTYYKVSIPENINSSNVILRLSASDSDGTAANNMVTYSLLENTTDFSLNQKTGEITASRIDHEKQQQYLLVAIASDSGIPTRQAYALLDILITDVNDNAPVIFPLSYFVNVSEAALVGVPLANIHATDADSGPNGEIFYSIAEGNNASRFAIQKNTGKISLNAMLNHEGAAKTFTLIVSAMDRFGIEAANNATVIIRVTDVNDNQPIFDVSQYVKTVPEDLHAGSSILQVHAVDEDGTSVNSNIIYSIVTSNATGNFSINSTNGVIYSSQSFDYETVSHYSFQVQAHDTAKNALKGRAMATVYIADVNDNRPIPDKNYYNLNVSANARVGSQIISIFATDNDAGLNKQLQFSIRNGNDDSRFTISSRGVIYLAKTLNIMGQSQYSLDVMIEDKGIPSLSANVTVLINVIYEATSLISFLKSQYFFTVNETTSNSLVGQVRAVDRGNITSNYITYSIVANGNDVKGIFHLDSNTGNIYINSTTNFEVRSQYDIFVRATNERGVVATAIVTINIIDVNETPFFLHTTNGNYVFNISESATPYTYVHSVFAIDHDTGSNGQLTYSLILQPELQSIFSVDQQGRIYTKASLDFESRKQYLFQVQVEDNGSPKLSAITNVTIDVLDSNDHPPVFVVPTPQIITVNENPINGAHVGFLNATDADSTINGQIQYVAVYPTGILTVDQYTGRLSIGNSSYFDYEKVQSYKLIAVVKDLGTPNMKSTKEIHLTIINTNDNDPYFSTAAYNISITEVTPVGNLIITLHAHDKDLGVSGSIKEYSIVSGDTSKFRIDNTGSVYLKEQLSYSIESMYHLVVNATDNGMPARSGQANVYINVLDLSRLQPTFLLSNYYKTVQENNDLNQDLLQVNATTLEAIHGPFVYSINPNNDSKYFTIDNTTGMIKNTIRFDYERKNMFTFTVQVLDAHNQKTGTAHVIIYVSDVNDNIPMFASTKNIFNISEATSVGASVLSLSASDNDSTTNSMLQFVAVSGDGMDKFLVESDGRILLKSPVDSKVKNNYTLTVQVEDMGTPALRSNTTLIINIRPVSLAHLSQPIFNQSSYVIEIDEGVMATPLLFVYVTNQAISSSITYTLIGPASETSPFSISPSGAINLILELDYLTKKFYSFRVRALNTEGRAAYATVTVHVRDVNNRRPFFMPSSYNVEILENLQIGMDVLQLMTRDEDASNLNTAYIFKIISGNADGKFNVSSTGMIQLMDMIDSEGMNGTLYNLTVSVQEGNTSSMSYANVLIKVRDINDNRPVFKQSVYAFNVSEATLPGTLISTLLAADADRTNKNSIVHYSLINGADFYLSIDGNLTVKNNLDYELKKEYELVALAVDSGSPSLKGTALIKINILDINDQIPYFKRMYYNNSVSEAFPVGGIVLTVDAYDSDTGLGGMLNYSLIDPTFTFKIDSLGRVVLLKKLDYESHKNYTLTVNVTDGEGNKALRSAAIYIKVTEVNDNQPSFALGYYKFYVFENALIGSVIGNVMATDKDHLNQAITYSIPPNAHSGNFTIHNNGSIILKSSLDHEKTSFFSFLVRATDQGSPSQYDQASVSIVVKDVNDNYPIPAKNVYHLNISEQTVVGTQVLVILCTDKDLGKNGQLTYVKTAGDPTRVFYIDNNGILYVMKQLDSFNQPSFSINVTVHDNGIPQKSAVVIIYIRVLPTSSDQIRFEQNQYIFNVTENVIAGPFGPLKVIDVGNHTSKAMVYEAITNQADIDGIFYVSPTSGMIYMNKTIDHEHRRQFDFQVRASNDRGLITSTHVTFVVSNANEMAYFINTINGTYNFNISESVPLYSFVGQVTVKDDDTRTASSLSYSLLPSSINSLLTIDHFGRIFTKSALDYEMNHTVSFKVRLQDNAGVATADIFLLLIDDNDNHPSFSQSVYYLNVSEDSMVGYIVKNFTATDNDTTMNNNQITYSLSTENADFAISNNGQFMVNRKLDYSHKSNYELTIIATDNGHPSMTGNAIILISVIDVNDNEPIFPSFCNNRISENSPVGMVVVTCTATDKDMVGSLSYTLNGSSSFDVDQNGAVTLKEPLDGTELSFNLTLKVTDGVHTTMTTVRVDVAPVVICRPIFNQSLYIGYVKETSPIQTSILTVAAIDSKNNSLSYSVEAGVTAFRIDSKGVLRTNSLLDYSIKSMYLFKVNANGGSSVAESIVMIHLIDVNNKLPIPGKMEYTVQVSEKAAIGAIVIGINATDQDLHTRLTYSIRSGNTRDSFRVDSSGHVLVKNALDYELLPSYTLIIHVSDGVHNTPVKVNINVLDVNEPTTCGPCLACPPVSTFDFSMPAFIASVSENTTVGSVATKVELNHAAKYNMIVGNFSIEDAMAKKYFTINQTTGEITLSKPLDAATLLLLEKFTFPVYNQFQCRRAATQIILNNMFSSCPLQFTKQNYEVSIVENFPINQVFVTVQRKQPSASIVYYIVENAAKFLFSINNSTGEVSLISKLSYEMKTLHQFTVMANVSNLLSYATVTVHVLDVNDNCPQITTSSGTYYQPIHQGTIVGSVMVNDSDSFKNHTFAITGGDVNQNFTIDEYGLLRARTVLISNLKDIFNLAVTVSDGVCAKTESVTIVVKKDTPPPCPSPPSCYNYTCAPCATTQPLTKCPDKFCPGCQVCPTTRAPCPTTAMTTACPVKTCPACPTTCPATVTCPVCPTLHCPACLSFTNYIFKQAYYSVDIPENETVPSTAISVHISGNFPATYSIVGTNASSKFYIDSSTGKISLVKQLNYTTQRMHQLTVRATIGSVYSEAIVVINVLDVNNDCPVFKQARVDAVFTNPVEMGTLIAWNQATDADVKPPLVYSIVGGDVTGEFIIDNMGFIRTRKRVQVFNSKTFNLDIMVTDGLCSARSLVVVKIQSHNSSSTSTTSSCKNYMFPLTHYWTSVVENTTYLNPVLTVHVAGSMAANYTIAEQSALQNFRINSTSGDIMLVNLLDYESQIEYNFTVRASFVGGLQTRVTVTVTVSNINDNNPYFIHPTYFATVNEYTLSDSNIAHVLASDSDGKDSVRMAIVSGNTNQLFSINSITGEICLDKQPYLYIENTYKLKVALNDTGGRQASIRATVMVHIERITKSKMGCLYYDDVSYVSKTLLENSPVGTVVAAITGTPVAANRHIRYTIANSVAKNYFSINATTGEIRLKSSLDYEKNTFHVIIVNARDPVTNITSSLSINVNVTNVDEHPLIFTSAPVSATVSELASIGAYVAQVRATDADGSTQLSHAITRGDDGTFIIDATTGVIRLHSNISHSVVPAYMLTICATDSLSSNVACHNITVNIKNENNNDIVFGKLSYDATISRNLTVGTIVTTIYARDPDNLGPITFSIVGATSNEYFTVDSSGTVRTNKSLSAPGLSSPYVLTVCAADNGSPPNKKCVPIIIQTASAAVAKPNNYDPYFLQSTFNAVINENATIGSTVLTLYANDNDTDMTGLLHFNALNGLGNEYFKVDALEGRITTLKALNTNATPNAFFLTTNVRDHGTPPRYSPNINVTIAVLSPSFVNNTITSVSSLTMDVILSKEPFIDAKIIKYEIIAQEYDPNAKNYNDLTAMHPVSWYFVNFIPNKYHNRRFIIGHIVPTSNVRRKRREVLDAAQSSYVKFRAGNEAGCDKKTLETDVCNGPLMPGRSYRYQLVGYYADNNPVTGAFTEPMSTTLASTSAATGVMNSSYIATYWIIGLVVLSLMFFIAVLTIVVILCYKKRYRVFIEEPKTFMNPVYADDVQKAPHGEQHDLNFYASDRTDGYSTIETLKNQQASSHLVAPEEFEMMSQPTMTTLGPHHSFQDYESISNQLSFDEESPEWASMDISLKVDPSGRQDPVILTRERLSDGDSTKKESVSSSSSTNGRVTPDYSDHEYDNPPPQTGRKSHRISVAADDYDEGQGITKL